MADCYSIRSFHPDGRRCDLRLGRITGVPGPGITHSHQHTHFHVTVADGLARETDFSHEVPHVQHYQLRLGHLLRLALQVLNAAGGAPRVASADVHDVHPGVLFYGEHQPLAPFDVEGPHAFYFQFRHSLLLSWATALRVSHPERPSKRAHASQDCAPLGGLSRSFGKLPSEHLTLSSEHKPERMPRTRRR